MTTSRSKLIKDFLISPKKTSQELVNYKNIKHILKEFIVFDICVIFAFGLLNAFLFILFDEYKVIFNDRNIASNPFIKRGLIVVILAPVMEEFAFRLGLIVNKRNLAIGIGCQLIILLTILNIIELPLYYRVILMIISCSIIYLTLSKRILSFFLKYQNTFVYYNILVFGLLHSFNYNYTEFWHFSFIPFLISIQLVLGIYLSYARMKHGFFTALSFHILHNSFFYLLGLLIKS